VPLIASLALLALAVLPLPALAWNIPGHMLSAAIAYQVLHQESPQTIEKVRAVLEKHPWYATQWQARLQDVHIADHGLVLFMQASRWPDDIRRTDKQYHRGPWHYINWPINPQGQPLGVQRRDAEPVNILTALAENEGVVKNENDGERKAIALAWLFHLVGDIRYGFRELPVPPGTDQGQQVHHRSYRRSGFSSRSRGDSETVPSSVSCKAYLSSSALFLSFSFSLIRSR
jgi:S1/P1 Nuclease